MARVKVTEQNIKALLTGWVPANSTTRGDELVYKAGDINEENWRDQAWQPVPVGANMIILFQDDATPGFRKITFVERLS
jgi:hypothetical protein